MNMPEIAQLISFLKRCYQADNRELSVFNFFGKSIQHRLLLKNADLIEGKHEWYPVSTEWGEEMAKKLAVYGKEKQLLLGAFFVVGKAEIAGEALSLCAPLLLRNLELIEHEEVYYLSFTEDNFTVNPSAVRALSADGEADIGELIIEALSGKQRLDFDAYHRIEEVLKEYGTGLHIPSPFSLESPASETAIKQSIRQNNGQLGLMPAVGACLVNKQVSNRDLLNELDTLIQADSFSPPLRQLLQRESIKIKDQTASNLYVPADLNLVQQGILKNMFNYAVSTVIGPPGTGKSFTIAGIAADCIAQGQTVLIAAQSDQAVDVIHQKIKENLGLEGIVMRGGRKGYKKELKARLEQLVYGKGVPDVSMRSLRQIRQEVSKLQKHIDQLEDMINRREREELSIGEYLLNHQELAWWKRLWLQWRKRRHQGIMPIYEMVQKLDHYYDKRQELFQKLVEMEFYHRLNEVIDYYWEDFKLFLQAVKARTGNKKEGLFEATRFEKITKAIPVWLVNCNDIGRVLPLQENLFDLVVIDEATQCNLASCLPVLQRGEQAVIVGDPKQLRHVSFLSGSRQSLMAKKCRLSVADRERLDYRKVSLMDLALQEASSSQQLHFLDEHYRSLPDIIQFSNKHFYSNALKVMSETPITRAEKNMHIHIQKGKRYKRGYNKVEAEAILAAVEKIIERENSLSPGLKQKIGILSPFREQVNYIQKQVEQQFTLEQLEAHRILIGTPFHFQGEERDVMFLSFVVDSDTHPSTFLYLNRPDVFNVSITRARIAQQVYVSLADDQISGQKGLFGDYLRYIRAWEQQDIHPPEQAFKDVFFNEVLAFLNDNFEVDIFPNYTIGNQEIDLLLVKGGDTYCINLIGYPGPYGTAFPVERYRQLNRMGAEVFPLAYSRWHWERETAEKNIMKWLN